MTEDAKTLRLVRKASGEYLVVFYDHEVEGDEEIARGLSAAEAFRMEVELETARRILES